MAKVNWSLRSFTMCELKPSGWEHIDPPLPFKVPVTLGCFVISQMTSKFLDVFAALKTYEAITFWRCHQLPSFPQSTYFNFPIPRSSSQRLQFIHGKIWKKCCKLFNSHGLFWFKTSPETFLSAVQGMSPYIQLIIWLESKSLSLVSVDLSVASSPG